MASEIGVQKLMHTNATQAATINSSGQLIIDDGLQKSEGGAVNTSIQQGLAKAYHAFQQNSVGSSIIATNTVGNSLNISSVTDLETGGIKPALTNAMSDIEYAAVCSAHYAGNLSNDNNSRFAGPSVPATSNYRCFAQWQNGSAEDAYHQNAVFGDLA